MLSPNFKKVQLLFTIRKIRKIQCTESVLFCTSAFLTNFQRLTCLIFVLQAAFHDDEHFQGALQTSDGFDGDENTNEMEDCKPVTFYSFNT